MHTGEAVQQDMENWHGRGIKPGRCAKPREKDTHSELGTPTSMPGSSAPSPSSSLRSSSSRRRPRRVAVALRRAAARWGAMGVYRWARAPPAEYPDDGGELELSRARAVPGSSISGW